MDGTKSKRGRRRTAIGLRKHQHVDGVIVEEVFPLYDPSERERKVGDGIYVSATTANNKRFYGVLVDQASLKEASSLFFQDQNDSLRLNQRMNLLNSKQESSISDAKTENTSKQGPLERTKDVQHPAKRAKVSSDEDFLQKERPVQKFQYIEEEDDNNNKERPNDPTSRADKSSYYRVLVATFSSVYEASCGDVVKGRAIYEACESGGNFLSNHADAYYYQYEILPPSLQMDEEAASKLSVIRTSMGFHSFLHTTALPPWYPLSNLYSQSKVLDLLHLKQGSNGKIEWDQQKATTTANDAVTIGGGGTLLSMQPRAKKQYQIGVIGGGIAGLACCRELVKQLKNDGIHAKVTLVEARSRLGGRIATDRSWKTEQNKEFPVELGAQWIHGIDDNPLANLAQTAGIDFVNVSEEVKMIGRNMKEVDTKMDETMGKLFDDLLDHATEDCWTTSNERSKGGATLEGKDPQAAVKWYASCFSKSDAGLEGAFPMSSPSNVPPHRKSNDRSVDCEIGKAITRHKFRDFSNLSAEEHRMLLWNSKNVEYALGSNLDNLSMKYWDVDDRHAFEGDHVLLKQGYSALIEYMFRSLTAHGSDAFESFLEYPVGKVEYGRKSVSEAYGKDRFGRDRHFIDLSDSCSITSEDGSDTKYFDFLVSAVPLGVLKESVEREKDSNFQSKMTFVPPLPFSKMDAIQNTGFGLLNKVYVQFPHAFWRVPGFFKDDGDCLFGNVSGVNPHHYMFFDIGKRLGTPEDSPAILMSLVSGKEAVALECLSDADVIKEVVETLQAMFSESISIPDPIAFRITRWGKDRFSRGSYTYLAPGSTDQDFQILQSPINANGDSLLLEGGTEVMRLFFAGEHTTALHPSVTHGAMLSGIRAAQEVISNIHSTKQSKSEKDLDKVIPLSIFRHLNPTTPLECNLCHKFGGRTREGPLLAFKRGARQVIVHNNCAEFCPEVEVVDFKWKNVIKAVSRGKTFTCCHCSQNGATIGCAAANCFRMFHFSCAEDTAWRFDRDGKVFFCDECRAVPSKSDRAQCDRISIEYYTMKTSDAKVVCHLCRIPGNERLGELLAFQQGKELCCVHLNCIKYTTVVNTFEIEDSRMNHEYRNVFKAIQQSTLCSSCGLAGATIRCAVSGCDHTFHYHCAVNDSSWDFQRKGSKKFRCKDHRKKRTTRTKDEPTDGAFVEEEKPAKAATHNGLTFQHDLFSSFGATAKSPGGKSTFFSGNSDMHDVVDSPGRFDSPAKGDPTASVIDISSDEEISEDEDSFFGENEDGRCLEVMDLPLSREVSGSTQLVRLERSSRDECWNISLQVRKQDHSLVLAVASSKNTKDDPSLQNPFSLMADDVIVSINGSKIGSNGLESLRGVLFRMKQEVDLMLEVIRN